MSPGPAFLRLLNLGGECPPPGGVKLLEMFYSITRGPRWDPAGAGGALKDVESSQSSVLDVLLMKAGATFCPFCPFCPEDAPSKGTLCPCGELWDR